MRRKFKVGDRVRIVNGGPHGSYEGYGTIVNVRNSSCLVFHDEYNPDMHEGGGLVKVGHGWWYFTLDVGTVLKPILPWEINPNVDLADVL